jgi:hypothetical protein
VHRIRELEREIELGVPIEKDFHNSSLPASEVNSQQQEKR